MKIVIDGRMLFWSGVGRYTAALLDNLEQIDHDNEYVVLMRKADWGKWAPTGANFCRVEANIDPYSLGEQFALPGLLSRLRPDLVHFVAPNTPLLYRGRRVVTVHDLTLLDYDTSRGSGWRKVLRGLKRLPFRWVMRNNAKSADRLIVPTQFVKGAIVKRYGTDESRVAVTMEAADLKTVRPEPLGRLGLTGDYLLYVGNFYPYKNVASTIAALGLLAEKYPTLQLVLAGKPDQFCEELRERAKELGLADRVVFAGFVSDGELAALYRGAKLYVFPSLSEGFGLPGLEAMTQGLPVLAARASCLPEVYGEAAEYFDPQDAKDQARKITELLGDEGERVRLREAGYERVKQFSWRKMAEETLEVYRAALKG